MSDIMFVGNHPTKKIRFASEPIYNGLCSLCLLSQDDLDRISTWVDVTRQHLTDEERRQAERACHVLPFVNRSEVDSIPSWITAFSSMDPSNIGLMNADRLRQKAIDHLGASDIPDLQEIVSDRDTYVGLVARIHAAKGHECDCAEEETVFDELRDGTAYRERLLESVRNLWEKYLRDEWPRVAPTVATSVAAFQSIEVPGDTIEDQLKFITERDAIPKEWLSTLEKASEVVYIPSVHIGPFMILFEYDGTTAYVVGRARIPEGSTVRAAELDRSDLLIRLDALSDATRLRVLELAADRGSITTQEVMDGLQLSQSSASRHLTQLTATGLLTVDASERTKRYRLNVSRVDQVFSGLKELLGSKVRA